MSTRPFLARGKSVVRCNDCLLAAKYCMCGLWVGSQTSMNILLLMHRGEVFKPSNTGRLIAQVFPQQTRVFQWSRTEPEPSLLALLTSEKYHPVILFPSEGVANERACSALNLACENRKQLLIVLDGTWKQAKKMFKSSEWLQGFPVYSVTPTLLGEYRLRKASNDARLSTAEAVALAMEDGDQIAAGHLMDTFTVFNERYHAARMQRPIPVSESEGRLLKYIALQQG